MQFSERINWSAIRAEAEEKYRDLFPERQIYFRSRGVVRFVSLSPRFQLISITAAFTATCWIGIASANLIFGNELIEQKEQQIADLREIRADLHNQLVKLEGDIMERAHALQARQQLIDGLLDRTETVLGDAPNGDDAEQADTSTEAAPADDQLPVGGPAAPAASPQETDATTDSTKELNDRVSALEQLQQVMVTRLSEEVDKTTARLEKAITSAGLDLEDVIDAARPAHHIAAENMATGADMPRGGPMIPLQDGAALGLTDPAILYLAEKSDRLDQLEQAVAGIPFVKPVEHYYISSNFGRRRDPFSKRWAMHSGVDMASRWKTPVSVTASGTVTFVGWSGPYGRMVEVDHGNGFSTRYGHLTKAMVEKGDDVVSGDKIGLMGSTGRSTGTHLHYEVRFDNTPLNPLKFFEAAKYVQAAK